VIDQTMLRQHLLDMLKGGWAHATFDDAVAGLPAKLRGAKPPGQPHTPWRLVEHMRIAQWDIVDFSRNPRHISPTWPGGYWPEEDAPASSKAWTESIRAFKNDLKAMQKLIADKKADLLEPFAWGDGQTLAREAMLLADHNGYHIGQLILLRRVIGAWGSA